jgi:hypothetical protein
MDAIKAIGAIIGVVIFLGALTFGLNAIGFVRLKKYAARASYMLNASMLLLAAVAYLAAHTGHVKADIEFPTLTIGGGTAEHAAREQQLTMLSAALPASAVTPALQPEEQPSPQRKPKVPHG